jgi:hypothetical protein
VLDSEDNDTDDLFSGDADQYQNNAIEVHNDEDLEGSELGAGEFEVEFIVDIRKKRGRKKPREGYEYFVKWRGYPEGENSWISASQADTCLECVKVFHREYPDEPVPRYVAELFELGE